MTSSVLSANEAVVNGGAIAADCAPEICVGQLPRDTCAAQVSTVASVDFVSNSAERGAAMHVNNHRLEVNTAGGSFSSNVANSGAVVFAELSAPWRLTARPVGATSTRR